MSLTISPNMSLTIPAVSNQPGPQYAENINDSLTLIDQHDHSPGKGVQITPAGMDISSDLDFGDNNATGLRSVRFTSQGSPLNLASDLGCVYVSAVDLYYNDGNGNIVRITQGGGVAGSPGSITGLTPPATASYNSGSSTFIWQSDVNKPANMDFASAIFRNLTTGSNGVTVQASPGLASNYGLTLPLLPASQKFMTLDAAGVMSAPWSVDGSTIVVASNVVKVPAQGITATQIADHTVGLLELDTTVLQWNFAEYVVVTPGFNVRVATTVNGTLSTAFHNGSVVDGVTLATNDLILLKNQTLSTEDGVYVVQASGSPIRSTSYNTFTQLNYAGVHVTAGTANNNTDWFQNNVLTSLSDNQSWSQSQTYLFTVPANVNEIHLVDVVAGGGGGGAGGGNNGGTATQGGGGGAGAQPLPYMVLKVTPGDTFAMTVGNKGKGGIGTTTPTGAAGKAGGNTFIKSINNSLVDIYLPGASGGAGSNGSEGSAAPLGATTYANNNTLLGLSPVSPGGDGAATGSPNASNGTPTSRSFTAALGGTGLGIPNRGCAGGGGGNGLGIGGKGGDATAASTGNPGTSAANPGAGGGGASGILTGSTGANGGDGGEGLIRAAWLGAP